MYRRYVCVGFVAGFILRDFQWDPIRRRLDNFVTFRNVISNTFMAGTDAAKIEYILFKTILITV